MRNLKALQLSTVLGMNSFPPMMGGNEFIPSTGIAMIEIFT